MFTVKHFAFFTFFALPFPRGPPRRLAEMLATAYYRDAKKGVTMSYDRVKQYLEDQLSQIRSAGLYKGERVITSPQRAHIGVSGRNELLNMCVNNYLGLADHPESPRRPARRLIAGDMAWRASASSAARSNSQGSRTLARRVSRLRRHDPLLLLLRCQRRTFRDVPGGGGRGHFRRAEPCLDYRRLRLCKAQRYRYRNNDMADLEAKLKEANSAGFG